MLLNVDAILDTLVSKLPTINPNKHYWLIRTDGGNYYQDFLENNYIAIEPSSITLPILKEIERKAAGNPAQLSNFVKDHVRRTYANNDKRISNRTVGLKSNQIIRFLKEVNEGDIIIIPSANSDHVSFGEITQNYLAEFSDVELKNIKCPFELRRRVKWLKTMPRHRLDPNLYMVFTTHQMINQINNFANIIERSVNDFYVLFDNAHLIINIDTTRGISAKDLFGFGHLLLEELDRFSRFYNLDISSNDFEVQINVNSPGKVDYKSRIKKSTLVLGIIMFLCGGGYEDKEGHKLKTDGIPGLINAYSTYQDEQQDRELKAKLFEKYSDSLKVRNPEEFNKLMKQFSENKDLPK